MKNYNETMFQITQLKIIILFILSVLKEKSFKKIKEQLTNAPMLQF